MAEDYIDELDETLDDLEPVSGTPELMSISGWWSTKDKVPYE